MLPVNPESILDIWACFIVTRMLQVPVVICDANWNVVDANAVGQTLMRCPLDQSSGRPIRETWRDCPPLPMDRTQAVTAQCAFSVDAITHQWRLRYVPAASPDGLLQAWIILGEDVR